MTISYFKKGIAVAVCIALLMCSPVFVGAAGAYSGDTAEYFDEDVCCYGSIMSAEGDFTVQQSISDRAIVFDNEISIPVSVERDGWYNIGFTYKILSKNAEQMELELLIDGVLPFGEAATISLHTEYVRLNEKILTDNIGNELTPELVNADKWVTDFIKDSSGYITEPYAFYFGGGDHTITVNVTDGVLAISELKLSGITERPAYEEYISSYSESRTVEKYISKYEAEALVLRSSQAVTEGCDNSTASVSPVSDKTTVLNTLGGESWSMPGQAATWEIEAPADGLYTISLRYRQNFTNGLYTTRRISIDGDIPFNELSAVEFPYTASWVNMPLGGETPYYIYLTKGRHTLTVEATLGSMSEIVNKANAIILQLNRIYRNIISVTSSSPDAYRDYRLEEKIPGTIKELKSAARDVAALSDRLTELVGKRVSENSLLDRITLQLEGFCKKPRTIAAKLSQFQSNISSLGTWVYERYKQPLSLDYITVSSVIENKDGTKAGFFTELIHSFKQFLYSFNDAYAVTSQSQNKQNIEVWTSVGRDQYQIINQLTEESFNTKSQEYRARIRLISEAALMPAVVAGRGPDVALMLPSGTPINYAIRGAAYDVTVFDNYGDIEKRFSESAMTPYRMGTSVYALPNTISFSVLFYRADILSELGIDVPKTWKDVTKAIVQLSQNHMQFGFAPSLNSYATMLYQNGGELYTDTYYSALDGALQLSTFVDYTSLYGEYGLTVSFDFANRFRSGEMPMGIVDYTTFNTLEVFAPEIKGLWDIALVPGTENENGINHTVASVSTASMIIGDTDTPNGAWEYICWWTQADIQTRYGRAIENKLGASARYATANLEALAQMPWSGSFYHVLSEQLSMTEGIPEVAGGYFTSRHFTNAFRAVIYRGQDPIESLREYTEVINTEIRRKRTELHLDE